jgi:hypothetical protein
MTIHWEALGVVAVVSLVIGVLVVVLVSLALVALPARQPDPTDEPPDEPTDEALVISRGGGLPRATGTAIAAACLLVAATIVLYGFYLVIF